MNISTCGTAKPVNCECFSVSAHELAGNICTAADPIVWLKRRLHLKTSFKHWI